ncbi:MAG: TolC family outer membrane protein [Alteromonadaceae bacterium]|nr:TolC family outer membrane protein [Alteromonadaceae bacterium]
MTIKTTLFYVALVLAIVHGRISANERTAIPTDLYTLYAEAITQDPELKVARAAQKAASEALPQARSGLLPDLSISAEQRRYEQRTKAVEGFSSEREDHYSRQTLAASLNQALFDLPAWYRYQAGKSLKREAAAEFTNSLQSLGERLVTAYFRVLRAQSSLGARQSEQQALQRQQAQVERQLEAGIASRIDLLEVRAEKSRVSMELVNARSELTQSLRALKAITGLTVHSVQPLQRLPAKATIGRIAELSEKARSANPQLTLAQQKTLTARENARAAKSAHAPTLSLELSAQRDLSDSPDVVPSGYGDLTTDTASIAVRLELPLYSGGRTSSQSRERQHRLEQARQNLRLRRTDILNELESNFEKLQSTRQAISAGQQAVDARKLALKAAQKGQKAGIRDLVDILRARREQFAAIDVLNDARYEYVTTLARIYRLIGGLDETRIRQINTWLAHK